MSAPILEHLDSLRVLRIPACSSNFPCVSQSLPEMDLLDRRESRSYCASSAQMPCTRKTLLSANTCLQIVDELLPPCWPMPSQCLPCWGQETVVEPLAKARGSLRSYVVNRRLGSRFQRESYFAPLLTQATIESQIYPQVATGFSDANAYLRELTLKSMLILAPKLSQKTVNQSLLKHLAKLQVLPSIWPL